MPFVASCRTATAMSATCQPSAVKACGVNAGIFWMRSIVPFTSSASAKSSSEVTLSPSVPS